LLFFHSHIIQRQKEPAKAHQIKLDVVVKALKWLEIDMDVDEVIQERIIYHILDSTVYGSRI